VSQIGDRYVDRCWWPRSPCDLRPHRNRENLGCDSASTILP